VVHLWFDPYHRLRTGMPVQLWPTHVRRGDSGYLVGKILYAPKFPVSQEELLRLIEYEDGAKEHSFYGPYLLVRTELV
jgi:hypothetical protein